MTETPLAPGSVIGILGGGQLGRMLAQSAARLGFSTHIYSDRADEPAYAVSPAHTTGAFDDPGAVTKFARACDVVTFEFENIPLAALEAASGHALVAPSTQSLALTQDRLIEKNFLSRLGIPVAPFAAVDTESDLDTALDQTGLPALIKTRRLGYDGKGQAKIGFADEARPAFASLGGTACVVESFVDFAREISVIVARGRDGKLACYDVTENEHRNHILATSRVPAGLIPVLATQAQDMAVQIANALDHVGVLCVEMFHTPHRTETPLVVNEIAPRVHNSGHWTIEACGISQFENHIRAIAGWPLGPTERHADAAMTNLIGHDVDDWMGLASDPEAILHLYGKSECLPGRKMGHVTRLYPRD